MLSLHLQCALEREVVGQSRAVRTLVRALTVARGRLWRPGTPVGVYLFMGPTGTGKSHLARSLATMLHGDHRRLAIADCVQCGSAEDWSLLMSQLASQWRGSEQGDAGLMAPHTIVLFEHLEAAEPAFVRALISALESGRVPLPDAKVGSLDGCLILLTSNMCAREIYGDERQLGFSPANDDLEDSEKARIFQVCSTEVERRWGSDLMARLDDLIVFHRLRVRHLPFIIERLLRELNGQLAPLGAECVLGASASRFLVERAEGFLDNGAWYLEKVFRRFVTFPIADLIASEALPSGGRIQVEHDRDDGLSFRTTLAAIGTNVATQSDTAYAVPIDWKSADSAAEPR